MLLGCAHFGLLKVAFIAPRGQRPASRVAKPLFTLLHARGVAHAVKQRGVNLSRAK